MSNNRGNVNDNDKTGDVMSWVIIIILMFVFPPVGWILLLIKLGLFANRKAKNITGKGTTGRTTTSKNVVVNQKRSRLEKKTGRGLSVFLLLLSIVQFIIGTIGFGVWLSTGFSDPLDLVLSMLFLTGGSISFFSRNIIAHRFSRYKNYYAFIEGRDIVPISSIAQMSGKSAKVVTRDLQAMINSGYLDSGAYIDNELECLVLSADAANKLRSEIYDEQLELSEAEEVPVSQYAASLAELREANSFIKDETISGKVSRLEDLTEKIFKIVEENPQKKSQLRRFMSYYLPTTLKLVRSYVTLESQGVKGENIMNTKKSIDNILDTLSIGFEQQLDQLFKSDAIDIATDINVLENLMQQDGLTSDNSEFRVAEAGG